MYSNNTDSEARLIAAQKGLGQWQQTGVKQEQNRIPWLAVGFFFLQSHSLFNLQPPVLFIFLHSQVLSNNPISLALFP